MFSAANFIAENQFKVHFFKKVIFFPDFSHFTINYSGVPFPVQFFESEENVHPTIGTKKKKKSHEKYK